MKILRICLALILALLLGGFYAPIAFAFCGFYVAKADTNLYNKASQVVIARSGDRTVLTMANDYQGEVKDFALVVPVPTVLQEDQVHIGEDKIIEHLDAFSAPRLVQYFDSNPCEVILPRAVPFPQSAPAPTLSGGNRRQRDEDLGVTVESRFSVGEYDILILSAKESDGLETWLRENDYQIPAGASELLQPYIRQGLKFFVAKVNLEEFADQGFKKLRPLMMAFESPRFMLPIRLGTLNAQGDQDLIVYLLSPKGQVELTNYRTNRIPSDVDIPEFVEAKFGDFYKSMFQKSYEGEGKRTAFVEYAWDMAWCDPCAAEPLSPEELRKAGVFWLTPEQSNNVFITRLHVRYTRDRFPEDLRFQETTNRENFQGRYVIRRPYKGEMKCDAARQYKRDVRDRQEKEAQTLAQITGWNLRDIRAQINFMGVEVDRPRPWWRDLWNR